MLELNKIYCGDCTEIMRNIDNSSIDLVLTDPPFFLPVTHYQSRQEWENKFSDLMVLKIFWDKVLEEITRILKPTGHLIFFCNCDSYPVFYEPTYNRFHRIKSLIWNKGSIGLGHIFRHQHELIIWARYSTSKEFPDGQTHADVLNYKVVQSDERDHPAEKPIPLLMELISPLSPFGGVVLDPFCGSGTTTIAAYQSGRNYIGIDYDKQYCDIATEKIAALPNTKLKQWF